MQHLADGIGQHLVGVWAFQMGRQNHQEGAHGCSDCVYFGGPARVSAILHTLHGLPHCQGSQQRTAQQGGELCVPAAVAALPGDPHEHNDCKFYASPAGVVPRLQRDAERLCDARAGNELYTSAGQPELAGGMPGKDPPACSRRCTWA